MATLEPDPAERRVPRLMPTPRPSCVLSAGGFETRVQVMTSQQDPIRGPRLLLRALSPAEIEDRCKRDLKLVSSGTTAIVIGSASTIARHSSEHAGAERVEAPTDPANLPMRTVFDRLGWELVGTLNEFDRDWVMYAISRPVWKARGHLLNELAEAVRSTPIRVRARLAVGAHSGSKPSTDAAILIGKCVGAR
jgi:hypothetical protein